MHTVILEETKVKNYENFCSSCATCTIIVHVLFQTVACMVVKYFIPDFDNLTSCHFHNSPIRKLVKFRLQHVLDH
jgi:hypothetical protein